jgi:hypothetical protein
MTPLDEAPEQRWRRTVERRDRPAKLKVDRLLRDFGYAALDAEVGDAIEARLAGVALAVSPSLRDTRTGEVVTIYADESAVERHLGPPAPTVERHDTAPAADPAVATDVAQMVTYLKQEVLDARAESERLRAELDRHIATRADAEVGAQATIAEQAGALQEQRRQIAELAAALEHTRQALAETREEIRRAVGELQALPEPELFPEAVVGDDEEDPGDERELAGEESYGDAQAFDDDDDDGGAAWPPAFPVAGDTASSGEDEWTAPVSGDDAPATDAATPAPAPEPVALGDQAAESEGELPALADPVLDAWETAPGVGEAADELEPSALRPDEPGSDRASPAPPEFDALALDLDEPPLGADAAAAARAADEAALELDPQILEDPAEPDPWVPAQLRGPEPGAGDPTQVHEIDGPPDEAGEPAADHDAAPSADTSAPLPAADGSVDEGEPPIGDDVVADFDEFLYDPDELYDPPASAAGDEPFDEFERDPAWLDQPTSALPAPPPAPPSPWAEEPEPAAPAAHERPMLGKVLRGRGGRSRGRWQGSCSICGREPAESKRKDLEAAGWDLDDEAAACPQCRGIG